MINQESKRIQSIVSSLLEHIKDGNCVLWLGSGLSIASGYLNWEDAVEALCQKIGVESLGNDRKSSILLDKADECKSADPLEYCKIINDTYSKEIITSDISLIDLIQLPFKAAVTTNFDPMLFRMFIGRLNGKHPWEYPNLQMISIERDPFAIFYTHGRAKEEEDPNNLKFIFSTSEFEEAYKIDELEGEIGECLDFFRNLISTYPILYLGTRIREPKMDVVFESVRKRFERRDSQISERPRGYILFDHERVTKTSTMKTEKDIEKERLKKIASEDRGYEQRNIFPLRYKLGEDGSEHIELTKIIKMVVDQYHKLKNNGVKASYE